MNTPRSESTPLSIISDTTEDSETEMICDSLGHISIGKRHERSPHPSIYNNNGSYSSSDFGNYSPSPYQALKRVDNKKTPRMFTFSTLTPRRPSSSFPLHPNYNHDITSRKEVVVLFPTEIENMHDTGDHQESQNRMWALIGEEQGALRRELVEESIDLRPTNYYPPITDIMRVHSFEYITHIQSIVSSLQPPSDQLTIEECDCEEGLSPLRTNEEEEEERTGCIDTDTRISSSSLDAALLTSGCAVHAVDIAMEEEGVKSIMVISRF